MKLVIHATDAESFARAVRNLKNARQASPDASIELLINAGAVQAAVQERFDDPALRVCRNSLAAQGLEARTDWILVDAAVIYAAAQQLSGWAYFRA